MYTFKNIQKLDNDMSDSIGEENCVIASAWMSLS